MSRGLRLLLFACALSAAAACREEPPPEIVKNSCLTSLNCSGEGVVCDPSTLMCVSPKTLEPYRVVLQVQPENTTIDVPDAGTVSLVPQAAFELGVLEGGIEDQLLPLPAAVRAQGRVRGQLDDAMVPLESEVTLMPRMSEAQLRSTVVNTAQNSQAKDDAGVLVNVDVLLDPELTYDVRVQPLLDASKKLPPYQSPMPYEPNQPLDIEIGSVEARSARLTSYPIASWDRVRLEDKPTGQVISSIEEVQGPPGDELDAGLSANTFTLYADQRVFKEPSKFNLVVGLNGFPRWQVKLALAGTHFQHNSTIQLPSVPDSALLGGQVENAETRAPLPYAELEFVSAFPVDEENVLEGNWCRLPGLPLSELSCSARLSTTAGSDGHFERPLIPGVYNVFVTPDRAASPDRATHVQPLRVGSGEEGIMRQIVPVKAATRYDGVVVSQNNERMPNVTINARSLGIYEKGFPDELERELARYNRSISAVTDANGVFALYPDIGRYDFSIETPSESGFAWMFCPNYSIKPREGRTPTVVPLRPFKPPSPVILAGHVEHAGVKLGNARIEAYAVWNTKPPRLLLVARATSDSEGKFRLAMPPQLPPTVRDETQTCPVVLVPPAPASSDGGLDSGLTSSESGVSTTTADGEAAMPDNAR